MKDVIGYEKYYAVDVHGNVFHKRTNCYIKHAFNSRGYLTVVVSQKGRRKRFFVHRLIAIHFIPNPYGLPQINHINGIKTDNRLQNLEWCTAQDNIKHARRLGLIRPRPLGTPGHSHPSPWRGARNPRAKLSNQQVAHIRSASAAGISQSQLARSYNVARRTIQKVITNVSYPCM